jgi:hypothetical protein
MCARLEACKTGYYRKDEMELFSKIGLFYQTIIGTRRGAMEKLC